MEAISVIQNVGRSKPQLCMFFLKFWFENRKLNSYFGCNRMRSVQKKGDAIKEKPVVDSWSCERRSIDKPKPELWERKMIIFSNFTSNKYATKFHVSRATVTYFHHTSRIFAKLRSLLGFYIGIKYCHSLFDFHVSIFHLELAWHWVSVTATTDV